MRNGVRWRPNGANQALEIFPFFPCHRDGRPVSLVSHGMFAEGDVERWEHPCLTCHQIYWSTRKGHCWAWLPIPSYTLGGQLSEPIDYLLVIERVARERAA